MTPILATRSHITQVFIHLILLVQFIIISNVIWLFWHCGPCLVFTSAPFLKSVRGTCLRPRLHEDDTGCIHIVSLAYSPFIYTRP